MGLTRLTIGVRLAIPAVRTFLEVNLPIITEISAILTSLNTARAMGSALLDLKEGEAIRDRVSELKDKISEAQDGLYHIGLERNALNDKVRELGEEIASLKKWESDKKRYRLVALSSNVMAMQIKDEVRGDEPQHLLCVNCFEDGKKRFLDQTISGDSYHEYKCHGCARVIHYYTGQTRRENYDYDYDPLPYR